MREILFRGKRISDGSWVEGGIIKTFHPNFDHESPEAFNFRKENCYCICANNRDIFVEQTSIGQFTGLTDKNGKKIFEGDIVSHFVNGKEFKGVVRYVDGAFGIRCEDGAGQFLCFCNNGEVIGNIHDNPELLKGGEG